MGRWLRNLRRMFRREPDWTFKWGSDYASKTVDDSLSSFEETAVAAEADELETALAIGSGSLLTGGSQANYVSPTNAFDAKELAASVMQTKLRPMGARGAYHATNES